MGVASSLRTELQGILHFDDSSKDIEKPQDNVTAQYFFIGQ